MHHSIDISFLFVQLPRLVGSAKGGVAPDLQRLEWQNRPKPVRRKLNYSKKEDRWMRHLRDALRQTLCRFEADNRGATAVEYVVMFVFMAVMAVSALPLLTKGFTAMVATLVAGLNK